MKANKFLLTALASAALVGCADDFAGVDNNGVSQDLNGKLVEAGLFSVDRNETADSRALNPLGGFVWMPTTLETDGSLGTTRTNQKVGFCWTGRNNESANFGAVATVGKNVYTNYEYEHVGWLDEEATAPQILDCTENTLANGAYIIGEGLPGADFTNKWNVTGRWNAYYTSAKTGSYTEQNHNESTGVLDLGRGVFSTKNASVFEGEYLVYYPYTDEFTKGEIIATLPREYTIDTSSDAFEAASESAFALGYVNHYKGGNSSSGLAAKTLNGYAVIRLYNDGPTNAIPVGKKISKVVIYSKSGDLLYSQSLNASACVSALANGNKLGTNVYGTLKSEKTNSIVANLTDGTNNYKEIEGVASFAPTEATKYSDYVYVAIPMLPQTIAQNFEIVLVDEDEKTCRINEAPATFTSNGAVYFDYNVANLTFKNEYMVTDAASLVAAFAKIYVDEPETLATAAHKILLLNDIKMEGLTELLAGTQNNYNSLFYNDNIVVTSECTEDPVLTLASEEKMSIKSMFNGTEQVYPTLTFDVPVVIEGAGCCEQLPAAAVIGGANEMDGKVVFNKNVTNHGALFVNNNLTEVDVRMVEFNATLENSYDEWAEDRELTDGAAELYFLGKDKETYVSVLNNKGYVKSAATNIDADKLFNNDEIVLNETTATKRCLEVEIGTLNNEGTAEIDKFTLVNVNTALNNKVAAAVIKTIGDGHSTVDGRLDVKGTSANKGAIDNTGVVNFTASSLDNDGIFIDRQNGQVGGLYVDNGTATGTTTKTYNGVTYKTDLGKAGIYVAQVATTERMGVVLSDEVVEPSTVIVEILGSDVTGGVYNLEEYEKTLNVKDVYVNSPSQAIMFKSYKYDETDGKNVPTESVFGHCVTVLNGSTLTATEGTLSTVAEVNVNQGGKFVSRAGKSTNADMEVNVTVGTNLNNAGTVEHTADLLTVSGNLTNSGTFDSDKAFAVGGNVTTSGTFDVDGTPNTITGNFTQTDGTVTFATQTVTTINGTFACTKGSFEREGLNGGNTYRATVNVKALGATTGSTSTAWPTVKK